VTEAVPMAPLRFDCPMCSRVQKVRLTETRCESCGARLSIFSDAAAAGRALAAGVGRSRDLRELGAGVYLVALL
jgi:hypothetical protein